MEHKYLDYLKIMLRENRLLFAAWLVSGLLMAALLWLYQLPVEPAILYLMLSAIALIIWCGFYLGRLHRIRHLLQAEDFDPSLYPVEVDACVKKMADQKEKMQKQSTQEKKMRTEMQDYFSLWAHQIKLPLSALHLQLELPELHADALDHECQRIDSCISLAMAYVRMEGSDFQIGWYSLESIIRPVLRENAVMFIRRHIRLETDLRGEKVCTDQKWATFIFEQLLSNALKYAPDFSVIQIVSEGATCILRDEGPGIPESDLPRVFEKGFTGENGRTHMSASSGLGLFLVKGVCDQLSISIELENRSCPLVYLDAPEDDSDVEGEEDLDEAALLDETLDADLDEGVDSTVRPQDPNAPACSPAPPLPGPCGLDVRLTFPVSSWISD